MKKRFIKLAAFLIMGSLTFSGCADKESDNDESQSQASDSNENDGSSSIFIYMCGSTLETKNGAATKNIDEILEADIPDNMNVIIETGGAAKWRDYDISESMISRYEVKDHKLNLIETYDNTSMGDESTLTDFLSYGVKNYSAQNMNVIFWDHGSGSTSGVCFDENYAMDSLTLTEIDNAFKNVSNEMDDKFEYVGFDACLMANIETADIISRYARNMIASEELEPSGGWNYKAVISSQNEDGYYDRLLDEYSKKCESSDKTTYTLSWIDFSKYSKVSDEFGKLTKSIYEFGQKNELKTVVDAASSSMSFGNNSSSEGYSNLVDLCDFSDSLGKSDVSKSISESVKCINGLGREGARGLSIYYPLADISSVEGEISNPIDDNYRNYLSENYQNISDEKLIEFTDNGSDNNGELRIGLTSDSLKYVQKVRYKMYQFNPSEDGEQAFCMGYDTNVKNDGKDGFVTSFGGKWITLNGEFINCTPVDEQTDTTTFSTPVLKNDIQGTLRYTYNLITKEIHLEGFLPQDFEDGSVARIETLEDSDVITIEYDDRTDAFTQNLKKGKSFTVGDGLEFKIQQFTDGFFLTYIEITDIFGNEFYSDSAVLYNSDEKLKIYELVGNIDYSLM